MLEFKEKRKFKKVLYSKPAILLILVLLVFLVKPAWNAYTKYSESRENAQLAKARLEKLQERKNELTQKIENLGTERGLEEEIVDKFDVVRSGENVIVIVNKRETEEGVGEDDSGGFFSSFWRKVKDIF